MTRNVRSPIQSSPRRELSASIVRLTTAALRSPSSVAPVASQSGPREPPAHAFRDVRVHRDAEASRAADALGAHAFAFGRHIVLGQSAPALATDDGRRLLLHELAHVAQAGHVVPTEPRFLGNASAERIAERAANTSEMPTTASSPSTDPAATIYPQFITPLGQGGGFGGLMERDRRAAMGRGQPGRDREPPPPIPSAIQGGFRSVRALDAATLASANVEQRIAMLQQLVEAWWTGGSEEEAIARVIETTPLPQARTLVTKLDAPYKDDKTLARALDDVVDMGNNLHLHEVLSTLRIKAMGVGPGVEALRQAPILPWHDVIGFFEDPATFSMEWTAAGKVRIDYHRGSVLLNSRRFASEVSQLPVEIFIGGYDYDPDQVLVIHDWDTGRFVPVVARDLVGYIHSGVRKFLGDVVTVASFAIPVTAAESLLARAAIFVMERALPALILLIDENRLNLVEWFPKWGPRMIYFADVAKVAVAAYGLGNFARGGYKFFQSWREARGARAALEGLTASGEAERVALALEKEADAMFKAVDDLAAESKAGAAATKAKPATAAADPGDLERVATAEPKVAPQGKEPSVTPDATRAVEGSGGPPPGGPGGGAGAAQVPAPAPGATGTRHLPREYKLPDRGSAFSDTPLQLGTAEQRTAGLVKGRGEPVGPGEVGTKSTTVPSGRTGVRDHWAQHGHEFPEFRNARAYEEGAVEFCRAPTTRRFYYRFHGRPTVGYYDLATGTFAASSVDGKTIFTFMRPGPDGIEGVLRASRMPEAAAGAPRVMPPGVTPRGSVPFR